MVAVPSCDVALDAPPVVVVFFQGLQEAFVLVLGPAALSVFVLLANVFARGLAHDGLGLGFECLFLYGDIVVFGL